MYARIDTKSYTFASQFQVKQQYNKTGFQLTRPEARDKNLIKLAQAYTNQLNKTS